MNWKNVNLDDAYEAGRNLLENYTFETLLLEVHCNLKTEQLNATEIKTHARKMLFDKYQESLEILNDNIDNIVTKANKDRAE